ncbi:unnamed protein product [Meloidogyne enterolobii]|uniref:Uncharacterized protein n=1 Tax=Meloidogyne enterolobii TaxID=390850 RepID=A0ACB0Z873_MELEN
MPKKFFEEKTDRHSHNTFYLYFSIFLKQFSNFICWTLIGDGQGRGDICKIELRTPFPFLMNFLCKNFDNSKN